MGQPVDTDAGDDYVYAVSAPVSWQIQVCVVIDRLLGGTHITRVELIEVNLLLVHSLGLVEAHFLAEA